MGRKRRDGKCSIQKHKRNINEKGASSLMNTS
jgi:hypothetical protein